MKLDHIAIWTKDLERMREFYTKNFSFESTSKYTNIKKGFSSYFLLLKDAIKIEIMTLESLEHREKQIRTGFAHIALSVGSEEEVREFVEELRKKGVCIAGEPRWTGDGFYEAVIEDCDGNMIEITV